MDNQILVIEGHDVMVFSSPEAMLSKLEATDIRSGVYDVFDSSGRAIGLGVTDEPIERVRVVSVDEQPRHTMQLSAALVDALAATGIERAPLERLKLSELVQQAIRRFGLDS